MRSIPWFLAGALVVAACGGSEAPVAASQPSPELTKVLATAAPAGARAVADVKPGAKEGDEIVVSGEVGGSARPVVDGLAVFTLADPAKLTSCNRKPGDTCGTPWDYCCHPATEIADATITVEVHGADGRPLRTDLSTAGIRPLAKVVVTGRVGPRPDPRVLVVVATGIHVAQ